MKATALVIALVLSSLTAFSGNIVVGKSGKGSEVIIITGLGGTSPWKSTIEILSLKHTCYVISVKGLNGDKNLAVPDFNAIEMEILDYMIREEIDKPVLMAHSLGGIIAMHLAQSNSSLFNKVILVDAFPFSLSIYNPAFTKEIGLQQADILKKQMIGLSDQNYEAMWKQNIPELISDTIYQSAVLENILESERNSIVEAQSFVLSNDLRPELKNIKCPVVVLCSSYPFKKANLKNDEIRLRIEEQFRNIANCNIFINEQSRHFIMIDTPEWFIDKINQNLF